MNRAAHEMPTERQRRAATVAGIAYFVIIVTSMLSVVVGSSALTMGGVVPASLGEIADHQLLYRVGALYDLLMYAGVVLLAVALYVVLEPVGRQTALLALALRIGEAIVGGFTVVGSLTAVHLATSPGSGALDAGQRLDVVAWILQATAHGMTVLLVFLCLGTIANFALFFVSRYVPRWLSVWGMASCAVMLLGGGVRIVSPEHAAVPEMLGALTVMPFEIVVGLWLWIRGLSPRRPRG